MSHIHKRHNKRLWERTRRYVFNRDGYRCRACGKAGALECDHVKPLEDFPDQDYYAPGGLQALCRGCHIEKTRRERLKREAKRRKEHPPRSTPGELAWAALVAEMMD